MTVLSKMIDFKEEGTDTYEWTHKDSKGRVLGCRIELSVQTFVEVDRIEEGFEHRMNVPAGTYFCFRPQALRDGKRFGAGQVWQRFNTAMLRNVAVTNYLKRSEKRAKTISGKK